MALFSMGDAMIQTDVNDIRKEFAGKHLTDQELEIVGAAFNADEPTIFGKPNTDYIRRELEWYIGMDNNIRTMRPPIPDIWKRIADEFGFVTSNYGQRIFHEDFGNQFYAAINELLKRHSSRRAVMVYAGHDTIVEGTQAGRNDQLCTMYVSVMIRNQLLHYNVHMRSCDAVLGYRNDIAWHHFVHDLLLIHYNHRAQQRLGQATIMYFVDSLHIYSHDAGLVGAWMKEAEYERRAAADDPSRQ